MVDRGPVRRSFWRRTGEWLLILGTGTLTGVLMFDGGPVVAVMAGITAAAATYAFIG